MIFPEMFEPVCRIEVLAKNDTFIINSLLRCAAVEDGKTVGVDWPTIFSLVWGDEMTSNENFPDKLRIAVADVFLEIRKLEECLDPEERKIHSIVIDLLYLLYEKQVMETIEAAKKAANR